MGPLAEKFNLWMARRGAMRGRLSGEVKKPALKRDDISNIDIQQKVNRGDRSQELRLRHYPTIDVDYNELFAGQIEGELSDAKRKLNSLGYRNNPTAYVEVTEEYGPDEGSYARQEVTETGVRFDAPIPHNYPTVFRRKKEQVHVCLIAVGDEVHFLAHKETSAWLQPARHVTINESSARIGVRELRNDWYDHFGDELGGKNNVQWNIAR